MPADPVAIKAQVVGAMATRANLEVLTAGREVVQRSSKRWRRVTDSDPCGFCAMLATRGPVYHSAEKAGTGGNRYHGRCGCTAEPFEGDPDSWEPTPDEQRFIDAYEAVHEPGMSGEETAARMQAWLAENPLAVADDLIAGPSDALGVINDWNMPGGRTNCTNCATAFEMVLRDGRKRVALPLSDGRTTDELLSAWRKPDGKPLTVRSWGRVMTHSVQSVEDGLAKALTADGQRALLRVKWPGNTHHVCNVVRENGAFVVYDAQNGRIYPLRWLHVEASELRVLRSDNLDFVGNPADYFTGGA